MKVKDIVKSVLITLATLVVIYLAYFYVKANIADQAYLLGVQNANNSTTAAIAEQLNTNGQLVINLDGKDMTLKPVEEITE